MNKVFLYFTLIILSLTLTACSRPFQEWTLFTFNSEYPDFTYLRGRIDGYSSLEECLTSGDSAMRIKFGSYECAYDCERYEQKYGPYVCDKVCTHKGCRD